MYQRTSDEEPLGSRQVKVRLRVQRYFCDRKSPSRKTFVEQVPGLPERHRRSSTGLTGWLRSIAIELVRQQRRRSLDVILGRHSFATLDRPGQASDVGATNAMDSWKLPPSSASQGWGRRLCSTVMKASSVGPSFRRSCRMYSPSGKVKWRVSPDR